MDQYGRDSLKHQHLEERLELASGPTPLAQQGQFMKTVITVVLSALLFSACEQQQHNSISEVTELSPGQQCPAGGVLLSTGTDINGDGTLRADEIRTSNLICNGQNASPGAVGANGANGSDGNNGASPLVKTTVLAVGDSHCSSGGVRIDIGVDVPGDGGAADQVLSDSEIQSTEYVCNGTTPVFRSSVEAPAGAAGAYVISANAGSTNIGYDGGGGGSLLVQMMNGTLGGNVAIFSTGVVDAGVEWPTYTFEPGSNPLVVTSDFSPNMYVDIGLGVASNDGAFLVRELLYGRQGDGGVQLVTAVDVAQGATLALPSVVNWLRVPADIRNAGTIRSKPNEQYPISPKQIHLHAKNYYGLAGSRLAYNAESVDQGHGGYVSISAKRIVSRTEIQAAGANSEVAGAGGQVLLAASEIFVGGAIDARGGSSMSALGGAGGWVDIHNGGAQSTFHQAAIIIASGGDGVTAGGAAGTIDMVTSNQVTRLEGASIARGGSCTVSKCSAGAGGSLNVVVRGGELFVHSNFDASGGSGTERGGNAGAISIVDQLWSNTDQNPSNPFTVPAGSMHISGSLVANGGNGNTGGVGGRIVIKLSPGDWATGQGIEMLGYEKISLNGSGNGPAGVVTVAVPPTLRGTAEIGQTGAIVNTVDVFARGGASTSNFMGGTVTFAGSNAGGRIAAPTQFLLNTGAIDVSASPSGDQCLAGGRVNFSSAGPVENRGALTLGGCYPNVYGDFSYGAWLSLSSLSTLKQSGAINLSGPGGGQHGGTGGSLSFTATQVINSGDITARGGDGSLTGGQGGVVGMGSVQGATVNTGKVFIRDGIPAPRFGHGASFQLDGWVAASDD